MNNWVTDSDIPVLAPQPKNSAGWIVRVGFLSYNVEEVHLLRKEI
jgi:hypothetical protein